MFNFISNKTKKLAVAVTVGLLAIGLIAGCGNDASKKEKVLRVGAETTFPPFEFTDDKGNYIGFDIELTQAIAKKMGYKWEFKSMGFDALIPALKTNDIDVVASGINATPERAKVVIFSDEYFKEGGFITIVKKDNNDIKSMDDLTNKRVGAQIGTVPVEMAKKIPGTTVKEIDSNSQLFEELKAGTVDAVILDNAVAMYYLKQGADKDLKLVGKATDPEGTVMAFRQDDTKLRDEVNKALKELKEDGTYKKIYEKWFGTAPTAK